MECGEEFIVPEGKRNTRGDGGAGDLGGLRNARCDRVIVVVKIVLPAVLRCGGRACGCGLPCGRGLLDAASG